MKTTDRLKKIEDEVRDIIKTDSSAPVFIIQTVNEILGMLDIDTVTLYLDEQYQKNEDIRELEKENEDLRDEIETLKGEEDA